MAGQGNAYPQVVEEVASLPLASLPDDPQAATLFPKGALGLSPAPAEESAPGQTAEAARLSPAVQQVFDQVDENLDELGQSLSEMAATHELGQALQDQDLEKAASALEDLAGQVEQLSDPTKEGLAQALQQAADGLPPLDLEQLQKLQADLRQAAGQVQPEPAEEQPDLGAGPKPPQPVGGEPGEGGEAGAGSDAGQALRTVAEDLRGLGEIADALGAGSGAGGAKGQQGQTEPAARLQGGGSEQFSLKMNEDDPALAGILNPQPGKPGGQGVAQGSFSLTGPANQQTVQSYIIPYYYLWMWRDIVAAYFQP
jgi:hypothetical protein